MEIKVDEGKHATVTARAGGAEKVYWILKRNKQETVVAVDRYSYTFDAGRVVGDASCVLQFRAVYPHEVKTIDIPVTIREAIPEPIFTLRARQDGMVETPSRWRRRSAILKK